MGQIYKYKHDHRMELTCGVSKVCMGLYGMNYNKCTCEISQPLGYTSICGLYDIFPQTFLILPKSNYYTKKHGN